MINYEDELLVRIWLHGSGHAAGLIRSANRADVDAIDPTQDTVSTYISWWPGQDRNKHAQPIGLLKKRTANPKASYFQDKLAETGDRTRARFEEDEASFHPRENQAIALNQDVNGNPLLEAIVVTKPAHIINLPALGTVARYEHQKHGVIRVKVGDPKDAVIMNKVLLGTKLPAGDRSLWGLNLTQMAKWWTAFLNDPRNGYQYASTDSNCAGVMMGGLMAAGAEAYTTIKSARMYRLPSEVRDVALALEAKLDTLNMETRAFKNHYELGGDASLLNVMRAQAIEIYSLDEFKRASATPKFGFRREQISKMDDAIANYHKMGNWTSENFATKLKCLVAMMDNVLSHRRQKPNSDRRAGVERLGCQIVNLLSNEASSLNVFVARNRIAHECYIATNTRETMYPSTVAPGIKAKKRV